jgi:hypothetical protein
VQIAENWATWRFHDCLLLCGAAGVYSWFVANRRGEGEGLGCKFAQFISDLVVAQDHKSALHATESMMSDAKRLSVSVTV